MNFLLLFLSSLAIIPSLEALDLSQSTSLPKCLFKFPPHKPATIRYNYPLRFHSWISTLVLYDDIGTAHFDLSPHLKISPRSRHRCHPRENESRRGNENPVFDTGYVRSRYQDDNDDDFGLDDRPPTQPSPASRNSSLLRPRANVRTNLPDGIQRKGSRYGCSLHLYQAFILSEKFHHFCGHPFRIYQQRSSWDSTKSLSKYKTTPPRGLYHTPALNSLFFTDVIYLTSSPK